MPQIHVDTKQWMKSECTTLGGQLQANGTCYIDSPPAPYAMCMTQPYPALIKMDAGIRPYRKWWWLGFFVVWISSLVLLYPVWGWNVFNLFTYEFVAFIFIVYGRRLDKSWVILVGVIAIFIVFYFAILLKALIVDHSWYPDGVDWGGHVLAGFGLYVAVSMVGKIRQPIVNLVIALVIGILYEASEWICSTFLTLPNLWWDLANAVYDVRNNFIGGIVAMLVEFLSRRFDCRNSLPTMPTWMQ